MNFPQIELGGKRVTGKHAIDKVTGLPKVIGGYAVFLVDIYKGWEIERHVGGFVASSTTREGMDVETMTYPSLRAVRRSVDAFRENAKQQYGIGA